MITHHADAYYRDLHIIICYDTEADTYGLIVMRWQDNDWVCVSGQVSMVNRSGEYTITENLKRQLWDIYGERMEIEP